MPSILPTIRLRIALPLALAGLTACGGESGDASGAASDGPAVVREMDGDTAVVRTVSGSVWGEVRELVPEVSIGVLEGSEEYMLGRVVSIAVDDGGRIFVFDGQTLDLRVYGPDGAWLDTWGRDGEGPGEFGRVDGGLAVLSDGRVVVRDPGNARLQVFSPDGEPAGQWNVISGGFSTSSNFALWGDTILNPRVINMDSAESLEDWQSGFEVVSPEGEVVDTIPYPEVDFEESRISATSEDGSSTSMNLVPWAPQQTLTWHPDGFFVQGISDRYAITFLRDGAPLRIERGVQPISITGGEKAEARARVTRGLRQTDPNWRWNGPEIPDEKPAFRELFAGKDGRIWVQRELAGVESEDLDYDPSDPDDLEQRWSPTLVFDVFESDGSFMGTVRVPSDVTTYPAPIFDGDRMWAVTRDDLGVARVVRYRIQSPA